MNDQQQSRADALTLDCIMRIMRAEIPHAYFNSPAAGERFARAIEREVGARTIIDNAMAAASPAAENPKCGDDEDA